MVALAEQRKRAAHAREMKGVRRAERAAAAENKQRVFEVLQAQFPGITEEDVILSYYEEEWIAHVRQGEDNDFKGYRITIEEDGYAHR